MAVERVGPNQTVDAMWPNGVNVLVLCVTTVSRPHIVMETSRA